MRSINKFGAVSLVLLAGLAVGCDKKLEITFTNQTPQPRNVQLTTPYSTVAVGTVGPGHGVLTAKVKIRKHDLPAQLFWQADELSGAFIITEHASGSYHVNIVQTMQLVPTQPCPAPGQPRQPAPVHPAPRPAQPCPAQPVPSPVPPASSQPSPAGPMPAEPEPIGPLNPN